MQYFLICSLHFAVQFPVFKLCQVHLTSSPRRLIDFSLWSQTTFLDHPPNLSIPIPTFCPQSLQMCISAVSPTCPLLLAGILNPSLDSLSILGLPGPFYTKLQCCLPFPNSWLPSTTVFGIIYMTITFSLVFLGCTVLGVFWGHIFCSLPENSPPCTEPICMPETL